MQITALTYERHLHNSRPGRRISEPIQEWRGGLELCKGLNPLTTLYRNNIPR